MELPGPDGEIGASLRYLSQRYSMPYREVAGVLTDVGTEELAHLKWKYTLGISLGYSHRLALLLRNR